MQQIGEVTAVRGGMLEITFCRPEACAGCHGCDGRHKPTTLTIPGQACVGDTAIVSMPDKTLAKASVLAYVVPVAGLMAGLLCGSALFHSDAASALLGLAGLGIAAAAVALTDKMRRSNPEWTPVLERIIPKADSVQSKP